MSYDYPDGYVPPPPKKMTVKERIVDRYWDFVLWCALDAPSKSLNNWGLSKLRRQDEP